jgi:hypothetical protein
MSYEGAETVLIDAWLAGVFAADSTLTGLIASRYYAELAPAAATYPLVIWQHQSPPRDILTATDHSAAVDSLLLIKAVVNAPSYATAYPIISRIVNQLDRAQATISGGNILSCTREQSFRLTEFTDGVHYRHLGYLFRIISQAT